MTVAPARRVQALGAYAFDAVDQEVAKLKAQGVTPIDFGVGDPTAPTPAFIRQAGQHGIDRHAASGYPSYIGAPEFRQAVADWTWRRFGVKLDPATQVASSIGSKEAVFHFAEAVLDPGDLALVPSPGYPPYARGAAFAEAEVCPYPLTAAGGFLPDFEAIERDVLDRAKLLWLNYPNSPSGAVASRGFYLEALAFCREHSLILASDEAYSELFFTSEPPPSALEAGIEGVVVFQSLSKRSAMTGWRIGWICGDERLVGAFKKVKTNIDSGTPNFIQDAAIAALSDEEHVRAFRDEYRRKRDLLIEALVASGLPDCTPEATIYVWQRVPEGYTSVEFATRLLQPDLGVVTTPGPWIAAPTSDAGNPGEGYVRFALVPTLEETALAAQRLSAQRW